MNASEVTQYLFYLAILILGGVAVKLNLLNTTDVVALLAGLGVGHSVGASGIAKGLVNSNTEALQDNTQATKTNTLVTQNGTTPQTKEGV